MKRLALASGDWSLDFATARVVADGCAAALLGEATCLSWYDAERDYEAPAGATECHQGCPTRGYLDYAANRGATLLVEVDGGRFVFCYRAIGEFV
ncbi:MAG: hypothetical protein COW73_00470 [Nitrospirae bacterium CG18_big_fil_WC_8_21_14_2_50_70_55]|nr:hypothetical protein [Deltaproteobacteria bacterium]OIP63631.1 MAG: hypothetical protein AUK30_08115 [Nitrospirae bacterium CG2_30_70_394]PIQ07199.1 MAG: hypothetical protein COW73_00470 [Nitrospirae bacterium CG18_big_fil_WC_8_21_14_2_50_70_55]PIU77290.1 MAG: hypothetical protein COS73_11350 [Nitrospirae bacterium CG06_land_8_20_14_3_00_70_43]PIW83658.1 MAG: hypothetical protein COZ96_02220 [Nitrospirae bacterium CG_4_8_14_3_um_filter_70_85]PIX83678.1 MAG: hypothetical protein COZ33_04190 